MSESKQTTSQLVAKVMGAIGALITDKTNTYDNYNYISADNVLTHASKEMAKVGLCVSPSIIIDEYKDLGENNRKLWFARVVFKMNVTGGDDDGFCADWVGYGTDYKLPDKALYKAQTSGHKYFLMKLFNIGAGNTDSEHDQPEKTKPEKQKKSQPQTKKKPSKPAVTSKTTKEIEQRLSNTEDKHHGGGSRDISPEEMKTFDAHQYLKTSQNTTYTTIQEALVMTGSFENEQFAMDMIQSYPHYKNDWYDADGNLKGEIKGDKTVTKESALKVFNWCLENNGKSGNNGKS